jgi:hypothetical protein
MIARYGNTDRGCRRSTPIVFAQIAVNRALSAGAEPEVLATQSRSRKEW